MACAARSGQEIDAVADEIGGRAIACDVGKETHVRALIEQTVLIGGNAGFIGGIIVAEASLSFLGFGLPPGLPSWAGMLSRESRQYMEMAPRLAIWPGLCLTIVVYSINMFGDALRDLLDPACAAASDRL